MGTIKIEQYNAVGTSANRDAPVYDITTLLVSTKDATTGTTAESITLDINCRLLRVYGLEDHRICINTDTTNSLYVTVPAGLPYDTNVPPGAVLYYELDA